MRNNRRDSLDVRISGNVSRIILALALAWFLASMIR
jgi:hypothetical protein